MAATGLKVFRGKGSLALAEPFQKAEDLVAGLSPGFVVVADWNRDGWPDVAVVNANSDDVSILLSTACQARRLEVAVQPLACGAGAGPFSLDAVVQARDDGGNLAVCAAADVTAAIVPGTGTAGAVLSGPGFPPPPVLPSLPLASGVASFTTPNNKSLTIDQPGRHYRLQFSLPGLPPARSETFTLGAQLAILGPDAFCTSATYQTEGVYDQFSWTVAPPVLPPFRFTPSVQLTSSPPGPRTLGVSTWVDGCQASTSRSVFAGTWQATTLSSSGPLVVCVDCIGGTLTAAEQGGGPVGPRLWGYRTTSGGPVTSIPGETGASYALKGTDFPGPGSYWVVVTSTVECPSTPVVSNELMITVSAQADGEAQFLAVTTRNDENKLQWVYDPLPDEVCIRWNTAVSPTSTCVFPLVADCPTTGTDGPGWHRIVSPPAETKTSWDHTGLTRDLDYCYAVFVHNTSWSQGRLVKARPFDATGAVKWAYSTARRPWSRRRWARSASRRCRTTARSTPSRAAAAAGPGRQAGHLWPSPASSTPAPPLCRSPPAGRRSGASGSCSWPTTRASRRPWTRRRARPCGELVLHSRESTPRRERPR